MAPVAVSGFHQQHVSALDRDRFDHGRIVVATEVAREHHVQASPIELDRCSAENVAGPPQPNSGSAWDCPRLIERDRRQVLEGGPGIGFGVERQGGLVFRESVTVREFGVLLLQMSRVGE